MACSPAFENNQGAVQLAQNTATNFNFKQIDVRHHFLIELLRQGSISVTHVSYKYLHPGILADVLADGVFVAHQTILVKLGK